MAARGLHFLLAGAACLTATPAAADTLEEDLAKAYEANPTLVAARANQRAVDENVPIERSQGLPSLSATGGLNEYPYETNTSNAARQATASLSLGVPVYSGGGVKNGVRAAKTRVLAGRADLRGTESQVFSSVVAGYMDVIQNEALVGLASNNVQVLETNLQATSDRFEIGDLTRTDVAQSEARLALARGDLRSAQANLIRARENYIALVGDAPDALEAPPPLPGLPNDPDSAVDVALESNPDLIAAHERARAAGFDVRVASASRLPTVALSANGNYANYLGSLTDSAALFTPNSSTSATLGVRVSVPLYQGGRPSALRRQAQARESVALENIVATERDVIAQVRAAYSSWRAANEIIESSQTAVSAAELSLEGVRAENTVGNRTILDILDAQQELLRAQVQLVTARRNAYVAGFTLLAAMGHAEARDLGLGDESTLYDPEIYYERVRHELWDWDNDPAPVTESTRTVDIPAQDAEIPEQQTAK